MFKKYEAYMQWWTKVPKAWVGIPILQISEQATHVTIFVFNKIT